ncbi:hypothetical protein F4804DRAFT_150362 [Jackrogersella minutella]|nr:hypothetical protein F4804DRAFT_150362 [Jackrogersella minutella]
MQFSVITTLFTLAAVAIAAPADVMARTETPSCTTEQPNQVCCSSLLGVLTCLIQLGGTTCGGSTYCCDNSVSGGTGAINVNALNCVKIL